MIKFYLTRAWHQCYPSADCVCASYISVNRFSISVIRLLIVCVLAIYQSIGLASVFRKVVCRMHCLTVKACKGISNFLAVVLYCFVLLLDINAWFWNMNMIWDQGQFITLYIWLDHPYCKHYRFDTCPRHSIDRQTHWVRDSISISLNIAS